MYKKFLRTSCILAALLMAILPASAGTRLFLHDDSIPESVKRTLKKMYKTDKGQNYPCLTTYTGHPDLTNELEGFQRNDEMKGWVYYIDEKQSSRAEGRVMPLGLHWICNANAKFSKLSFDGEWSPIGITNKLVRVSINPTSNKVEFANPEDDDLLIHQAWENKLEEWRNKSDCEKFCELCNIL